MSRAPSHLRLLDLTSPDDLPWQSKPTTTPTEQPPRYTHTTTTRPRQTTPEQLEARRAELLAFAAFEGIPLAECSTYHYKTGPVNIYLPRFKVHVDNSSHTGQGLDDFLAICRQHLQLRRGR